MLKIGVLGAGHLGKIHIRLIKEIPSFTLVGFYDPDPEKAAEASKEFGVPAYNTIEELVDDVDAIDIVTPTLSHFHCAEIALAKGKHIFVEKPLTNSVEEAEKLVELVKETGVKAQVGHVERFNPAFLATEGMDIKPMFIEAHRLAEYNPRGTDVSVILDLMIHDIDILLSLVKSPVTHISASGVPVISDTPDIANARIEFANGCVANLTASRVSLKKMRKTRIFQKNAYITIDFLDKSLNLIKIRDLEDASEAKGFLLDPGQGKNPKEITLHTPKISEVNAIKMELEEFAASIMNNTTTAVTVEDGYNSLKLAYDILQKMNHMEIAL